MEIETSFPSNAGSRTQRSALKYVSFETSVGCVFVWVVHICSIKDHAYHHVKTNKMYIIIRIMNAVELFIHT